MTELHPRPPGDLGRLPPASLVLTTAGLLVAKITTVGGDLYGLVAYMNDDGTPTSGGSWTKFWGATWQRTLSLPARTYAPLITARQPDALVPGLGRIARIAPATVTGQISTRDPELLDQHADTLKRLAQWWQIAPETLGIRGSAMYKPAQARGDLDVVVYGAEASRSAHRHLRGVLPTRDHLHHLHVPLPGSTGLAIDPQFIATEPYTSALIGGELDRHPPEPLEKLKVIDATDGIFYPSRHVLDDGSVLLSYRLGHSCWLAEGDRVSGPALPVLTAGDIKYRAVLGYETLTAHRQQGRPTTG
jgi:hypothetical protein